MAVSRSVASDNGTWICSFARESGVPDDRIEVEVGFISPKLKLNDKDIF